ncbi:MAG TPA: leucine-rich repeat domain-containing protein [Spirochaetota bacterium]
MIKNLSSSAAELKSKITNNRLQEISVDIIARFKDKDLAGLTFYAKKIGVASDKTSLHKLFASLIQIYHPDRLAKIHIDIDKISASGDTDALRRLDAMYIFSLRPRERIVPRPIPTQESAEDYTYTAEDFGYDDTFSPEADIFEEWKDEEEPDEREMRIFDFGKNFTEAVNAHFFGNLDYTVTVGDLANLDGDLDLSDRDIIELSGIEYCIHLTGLNLSGNKIEKIDRLVHLTKLKTLYLSENEIESVAALSALTDLEEIDLSDNNIEDISPLLEIGSLLYLNIMNNPLDDRSIVEKLTEKGVIVIY